MKMTTQEILALIESEANKAGKALEKAKAERDAAQMEVDAAWKAQLNCTGSEYKELSMKTASLEGALTYYQEQYKYFDGKKDAVDWLLNVIRWHVGDTEENALTEALA